MTETEYSEAFAVGPGTDPIPRYAYRTRRYPWAERRIAEAEAQHGPPEPVCLCGSTVTTSGGRVVRCGECGRAPKDTDDPNKRCDDCGYIAVPAIARAMKVRACRCPGGPK